MTSYLIAGLTPEQVKLLQDAGITFYLVDQSDRSYIIEGPHRDNALQLLNCTADESPGPFVDVIELKLTPIPAKVERYTYIEGTNVIVEANGNELPTAEAVALVDRIVGAVVGAGRKIVLHLPPRGDRAKRVRAIVRDGDYHIHCWSSPAGKRRLTTPTSMLGLTVAPYQEKCYGLTGQGIPLLDTETEYAIGEIFEHDLYIHFDVLRTYRDDELCLFSAILERAVADLNLSPTARSVRTKERRSEGRNKSRQAYIKACGQRVRELIEMYSENLTRRFAQFASKQQDLLSLLRLDNFGGKAVPKAERTADFAAEYARIREVSRVKDVIVSGNLLMLKTDKLYAQHFESGQSHEIGEFLIVINLHGGTSPVRWYNSTRRVNGIRSGMNSPTVYADGSPMLDEILETMLELIARLELSVVAELAIQFVETVNNDLPGAYLERWPLANTNEVENER